MRIHVLETQPIIYLYTHICEMLSLDYNRTSFLTRASLCWIKKPVEIIREPNDGKQKWVIPIQIGISTYILWLYISAVQCINSTGICSAQWQGWVSNDVFPCLTRSTKAVNFETCVHWIFYSMVLVVNQASEYIDIYKSTKLFGKLHDFRKYLQTCWSKCNPTQTYKMNLNTSTTNVLKHLYYLPNLIESKLYKSYHI